MTHKADPDPVSAELPLLPRSDTQANTLRVRAIICRTRRWPAGLSMVLLSADSQRMASSQVSESAP